MCSHNNFISKIEYLNGNVYSDQANIDQAFINYFHNLWNAPSNVTLNIADALPPDLPRLLELDNISLIEEVTKEVFYRALSDIPTSNSLDQTDLT